MQTEEKVIVKQCLHCQAVYETSPKTGCSICPRCGQRSCSE